MTNIIPAVIPAGLDFINDRVSKVVGLAPKVQLDFVDGHYAPTMTWPFNKNQGDELLMMVRGEESFPYANQVELEADLLILHPVETIPDLISIGFRSFVIHIDSTDHVRECIETIKSAGLSAGLGIKPSTDSALLEKYIEQIDFVQFMGNDKVGYNGVSLDQNVVTKIYSFHKLHPDIPIQIDIGVNEENILMLKDAGVTRFISGSAIYNSPNPQEALKKLQSI